MPVSRARARMSLRSWSRICGSRLENGSSSSSRSGCATKARAMPTRCCWPPERRAGRRCASAPICIRSSIFCARFRRFGVRGGQRGRDIVQAGEMRPERVVLEHHAEAALGGRHEQRGLRVVDRVPAEADPAGGDALQPRRGAQDRRLAGAGAADQDQEFAGLKMQIDIVQDLGLVVALAHIFEAEKGHERSCEGRGRGGIGRRRAVRPGRWR